MYTGLSMQTVRECLERLRRCIGMSMKCRLTDSEICAAVKKLPPIATLVMDR